MRKFRYQATNMEGRLQTGIVQAQDEAAAQAQLAEQMLLGILIRPVGAFERKKKVPPRELAFFCRQLALALHSDITIIEGLRMAQEQAVDRTLKQALTGALASMEQESMGFTASMRWNGDHCFPTYMLNMLEVGEASGSLETVLTRLADYFEKDHKVRRKVRSAATYPAILTVLMLAVVVLMITQVLPMFDGILRSMGGEMPAITQALMGVGMFLASGAVPIVLALAILVVGALLYARTPGGARAADRVKLGIPIVRMVVSRVLTARFARSLALLLRSGVPLLTALEMMDTLIGNRYLEAQFQARRKQINEGRPMIEALSELRVFPSLFLRMLAIGEKTGHLDEMLSRSADMFDEEVDGALDRLTTIIEPLLIIVLSVIVGIILLSLMLPMINIMNAIG